MEDQTHNCDSTKIELIKLKLHAVYLISGLVISIILLATGEWTPQTKFTEYLSNAATLVSVVLGLVAIFYSFVSNDSLSKSLGSITNVTDQIGKTREQMAIYVDRTAETAKAAEAGTGHMREAMTEMRASATTIVSALQSMQDETNDLKKLLHQMPQRFDKIDGALATSKKNIALNIENPGSLHQNIPNAVVNKFLAISSPYIQLLIYALFLAHQKKQEFDLKNFTTTFGDTDIYFALGALMMADAIGLVDVDRIKDSDENIYSVREIDGALAEKISDSIRKSNGEIPLDEWLKNIADIEAMFEVKDSPDTKN